MGALFSARASGRIGLRDELLQAYHGCEFSGSNHVGHEKLYSTLRQKYFWHSMYSDVVQYVQTCDKCQRAKRFVHARPASLINLAAEEAFSRAHLDILGPLMATKDKKKYVLLMVHAANHWVKGASLSDQTATTVALAFYMNFITRYSAHVEVVKEHCTLFYIRHSKITPYNPQSNSQVERTIQSLSQAIRSFIEQEQENWSEILLFRSHGSSISN